MIATREHVASMFDLEPTLRDELIDFTARVRDILRRPFGDALVTEHGRVALCVQTATKLYEPHCLHAHRLVFTGVPALDLDTVAPAFRFMRHASFADAWNTRPDGQYLYCENADATCLTARVDRPLPRQFFRRIAATLDGNPEFANWVLHPRHELIIEAAERLRTSPRTG